MTSIEFAVSFRKGASTQGSGLDGSSIIISKPAVRWTEGLARWYDVRNKVMYIDDIERDNDVERDDCSGDAEAAVAAVPAQRLPCTARNDQDDGRAERAPFPRHVLDVRLVSCISPRGAELFGQLIAFSREWKEALAVDMLDLVIEAAADLGSLCGLVFDGVVADVAAIVAKNVYHGVHLAAANATATAAVAATTKASTSTSTVLDLQAATMIRAPEGQELVPAQQEEGGQQPLHVRSTTPTHAESAHKVEGDAPLERAVVDRDTSDKLSFRCMAIITERGKSGKPVSEGASEEAGLNSAANKQERTRHDRQYLASFT